MDLNILIFPLSVLLLLLSVVALLMMTIFPNANQAFLRTGLGGSKVIFQHASVVIPGLQHLTEVDLRTHVVSILLEKEQAILIRDYAKVDIHSKFLFRVSPEPETIATAAMSLGKKTADLDTLNSIFQDTFVSILRNTIANYTLKELTEISAEIEHEIYRSVDQVLYKNGIEIISVSLSKIKQTEKKYLNKNDAIDIKVLSYLERFRTNTELSLQQKILETESDLIEVDKQKLNLKLKHARDIFKKESDTKREIAEMDVANELAIHTMQQDAEQVQREAG